MNVLARESFRIGGVHFIIEVYQKLLNSFSVPLIEAAEVGERKNSAQSGQLFFFQAFPDAVTGKEENGLGMVDDMMHIVGRKVLQDRDDDGSVGDGCHVGDAPVGIIFADNGYFISSAQAAVFEKQVYTGDFSGYLAISIMNGFTIIGIAR